MLREYTTNRLLPTEYYFRVNGTTQQTIVFHHVERQTERCILRVAIVQLQVIAIARSKHAFWYWFTTGYWEVLNRFWCMAILPNLFHHVHNDSRFSPTNINDSFIFNSHQSVDDSISCTVMSPRFSQPFSFSLSTHPWIRSGYVLVAFQSVNIILFYYHNYASSPSNWLVFPARLKFHNDTCDYFIQWRPHIMPAISCSIPYIVCMPLSRKLLLVGLLTRYIWLMHCNNGCGFFHRRPCVKHNYCDIINFKHNNLFNNILHLVMQN